MKELFVQIPNNSLLNSLSANYGGMPFFLIIKKTEPMNYKVPVIHILTDYSINFEGESRYH